ncbi:hypothetical protein P170DRAFT_267552 [Aspergillus steynii IBT 23096]|uniref:Uncharacterized protein n=1 Tax=Aspergillus steynii IBT 23096 TaxID=1392250 RepID=A0A2I2FW39_9EURO|nr:uncharacterized protein P170DRAFT_267552 [Aspergillus steynii IBT 23096]PLB44834.1 hypothetical protein P170DRAFT_267552 [Aspergillus steynii IBT 23096]
MHCAEARQAGLRGYGVSGVPAPGMIIAVAADGGWSVLEGRDLDYLTARRDCATATSNAGGLRKLIY